MKSRRLGAINIPLCTVNDDPKAVAMAFSKIEFLPIQVTHDHMNNIIQYVGYSPTFKEIVEGECASTYDLNKEVNNEN